MVRLNKGETTCIYTISRRLRIPHGDNLLHIFECECGFTIAEKKRIVKTVSGQKKMTVYTVIRKRENKE
ncbi:MAG: hypothetical protein AOA66_1037 [Candidatus Bathyarchaeota archaeon BA2]|nr:MAG: hypothetical protein AOA66_1037 [Candidatus Bathyarchaeota archaeon BA2]